MGKCEIVVVICFHDFLELEQPVAQIFVSYNLMNGRPRTQCSMLVLGCYDSTGTKFQNQKMG